MGMRVKMTSKCLFIAGARVGIEFALVNVMVLFPVVVDDDGVVVMIILVGVVERCCWPGGGLDGVGFFISAVGMRWFRDSRFYGYFG